MNLQPLIRKILTALMTVYFRYVLIGLSVLIISLGYLLVLTEQIREVREVGILGLQTEQARLKNRQEYLAKIQSTLEAYNRSVVSHPVNLEDILPAGPSISQLFQTLEALTRDARLDVAAIAVTRGSSATAQPTEAVATTDSPESTATAATRGSSAPSTVEIIDVSLTVQGKIDYGTFKRMLKNFEDSQRLFDVAVINFRPSAVTGNENVEDSIIFELQTYYVSGQTFR